MTQPTATSIEVSRLTPAILRWGLGIFGAGIALLALHDLWRAIWPPSIVTPLFGLMLGVGVFIGGTVLLGAVFGPDEVWRIEPGKLTIRTSLRGARTLRAYGAANIGSVDVTESDWDTGPATYGLSIKLVTGKVLQSPAFGTRAKAEAARDMLG